LLHRHSRLDETWGYTNSLVAPSDTGIVCDWSSGEEGVVPVCSKGICEGHGENDALPFDSFTTANTATTSTATTTTTTTGGYLSAYTNAEMWSFLDPTNEDLPYMYENFEWEHCDQEVKRPNYIFNETTVSPPVTYMYQSVCVFLFFFLLFLQAHVSFCTADF
jgi:hypothetical protein